MKILTAAPYISSGEHPSFSRHGTGFGKVVADLTRDLAARGHESLLFTYARQTGFEWNGVNVLPFSAFGALKSFRGRGLASSVECFRRFGPRTNHPTWPRSAMRYAAETVAGEHLAHLITAHQPDVLHVHGITLDSLPILRAAYESGRPLLVTLHGVYSNDPFASESWDSRLEGRTIALLNQLGVCMTVVGSTLHETVCRQFDVQQPDKIRVVLNGIDLAEFSSVTSREQLRDSLGLPADKFILLSAGSLVPRKNQQSVIAALARLSPERRQRFLYVIVGDGPCRRELESAAAASQLTNVVRFMGYVARSELVRLLIASDFLVHPATSEGFGLPFVESLAAGTPVLGFLDQDGFRDIVTEGCGVGVEDRESEHLAAAIDSLPAVRTSADAMSAAAAKFDRRRTTELYEDAYRWSASSSQPRVEDLLGVLSSSG